MLPAWSLLTGRPARFSLQVVQVRQEEWKKLSPRPRLSPLISFPHFSHMSASSCAWGAVFKGTMARETVFTGKFESVQNYSWLIFSTLLKCFMLDC